MTAPRKFRGWWVLFFATVTMALSAPGQTIGVSSFVDPMIDELGITRNALSAAYLVGTLIASMFAPWVGRLLDHHGVRRTTIVIVIAFVIGIAFMGSVQNIVMLAVGFTLIRLLGQGSMTLASGKAISMWFSRRLGTANGIAATAAGLLMSLAPLGFTVIIDRAGWRSAWVIIAIGIGVVMLPIARWGLVDQPSDLGQFVDGSNDVESRTKDAESAGRSYTLSEATHNRSFWLLTANTAAVGAFSTGLIFQHVSIMEEAGLSETEAASVFLPMAISGGFTAFLFGILVDRFSSRLLLPLAMAAMATPMFIAADVSPGLTAWMYGAVLGVVGGSTHTLSATLYPRWFGVDNLGAMRGVSHVVGGAASAVGPLMMSIGQSVAGSYRPALRLYALIPITVGVASIMIGPPPKLPFETGRKQR